VKRGDYDHNHSLLSSSLGTIYVLIFLVVIALGGLSIGLFVLDKF
jgi:hypothetical protein